MFVNGVYKPTIFNKDFNTFFSQAQKAMIKIRIKNGHFPNPIYKHANEKHIGFGGGGEMSSRLTQRSQGTRVLYPRAPAIAEATAMITLRIIPKVLLDLSDMFVYFILRIKSRCKYRQVINFNDLRKFSAIRHRNDTRSGIICNRSYDK